MNPEEKKILKAFKDLGARVETRGRVKLKNRKDIALYYTPGVGVASRHLALHPEDARKMSVKKNSVAVISDGSAVLGLGNIGPYGALPVMEGKALIFREFAGIDAWPIVLSTQDPDEIVRTVIAIAPGWGGINLEDIKAPQCFEIERRLIEALDIPVMHDDQHGTAIVVLAGLINAATVVKKNLKKLRVVIAGAGAAGVATTKLLQAAGVTDIVLVDTKGAIHKGRTDLNSSKQELAKSTNPRRVSGELKDVLVGADVFIGVSGPGVLTAEMVKTMADKAIVFALSNPTPEILPDEARKGGAVVIATGRSDFPNQINNALVFPGIFRGALDKGVRAITQETKVRAAKALAGLVEKPTADKIIPDVLDKRVVPAIAKVVK
ncbi:MAG: NADP-dependent malic enzyme [Candidatus Pacebacteria bacterium]|nr:NADP-dependent malic enzyme [Candidatus Paceibacterota bacterium]